MRGGVSETWGERCHSNTTDDGLTRLDLGEGDVQAAIPGMRVDNPLQRPHITGFCPQVKVVDNDTIVDGYIENAHALVVIALATAFSVPRLGKIELDAVKGGVRRRRYGQVVPQTVTPEAEELEQLVALRAANIGCNVALRGLEWMNTGEILPLCC